VSARHDAQDAASPLSLLLADVGPLMKAAARQLGDKSPKTRVGMFTVLHTLVGVLPGSVAEHIGMLVPGGWVCLPEGGSPAHAHWHCLGPAAAAVCVHISVLTRHCPSCRAACATT
jgi:hypothetical protein